MFIEMKDVSLRYGGETSDVTVLEGINLTIEKGDFVTIVGPSGCGKSSLLKMVTGIQFPTGGEIRFQGEVIKSINPKRGMMFQDATLFPWLSVRDNIGFGLKMNGTTKKERQSQTDYYLKLMDLQDYADYVPYQLSGGMKQRVALARTLITSPDIIMMDEPFSALDAFTRRSMQKLITRIWQELNTTFLFVTHDVEEAVSIGSRVIVLSTRPGSIVEDIDLTAAENKETVVKTIYQLLEK